MANRVSVCGVDTSTLPKLKNQELEVLMQRVKSGDELARDEFIIANLRLVLSVVQRFYGKKEKADDMFQVGCVGLMKAIDNFDMSQDVRFSTYGVPMIVGEIRRYLRDNSAIRVSRSLRDVAYRVLQCKEQLQRDMDRDPTLEEIAAKLGLTREEVSEALDAICSPVSLYDPVYTDGGDPLTVMDQVRDMKNTEGVWMERIALRTAFRRLGDREKQILQLRFVGGKTQMEVASMVGISQAQVSRLEKGALGNLRKQMSVDPM